MPLTDHQIEILFEFTRKKFVPYYDLQVELVDHLATSIEEKMMAEPAISFDQALQKVYSSFGIFGFAHVVQEKEITLRKLHRKLLKQTLKTYFTLPRIAFTVALFCCVFYLSPLLKNILQEPIVLVLLYGCSTIGFRRMLAGKKADKKPLLLTSIAHFFSVSLYFVLPGFIFIAVINHNSTNFAFAAFVTAIVIVQKALIQIHRQIRKKAMVLYPEAFVTT